MKLLTTITAAVLVMAATGCETYPPMKPVSPEALAEYRAWKAKQPKIKFQPGTDMLGHAPTPVAWQGLQQQQPVVVTSGNYPVTTVAPNSMGGTTVVNYGLPAYTPPARPYPYYGY